MAEDAGSLSKSAKKRLAKQNRDAAHQQEEAPPPAPEPKAAAKGKAKAEAAPKAAAAAPKAGAAAAAPKAAAPKAAAGKAAAAPKAAAGKAAAAPAPVVEQPAAKAKGKAKAEPKAEAEPKAKAAAKASGKSKAKKPVEEEAPKPPAEELAPGTYLDDGTGGDWETLAVGSKKNQKKKDKTDGAAGGSAQGQATQGGKSSAPAPRTAASAARGNQPVSTTRAQKVESAAADVERILNMKLAPSPETSTAPEPAAHTATIVVPEPKIGIVVGPKGATLKLIQEKTGVQRIDTTGGVFQVAGDEKDVKSALEYIKEIIDKGYTSLNWEDFAESYVNVHPSYFPDIIGTKGSVIQEIKKQLKVEVNIPEVPANSPKDKKFKVSLAGSAKQVEEAKDCINNIMMYSHSDITHPGMVHEELEIEQWMYSFIIGKGGSEMKHIQKNWEVKVTIPREHSMNQKVLIAGSPESVARSKAYVEKLLASAETASRGREKAEKAEDTWGDEAPEEGWMKDYIYRRS